jgi:AAA domain
MHFLTRLLSLFLTRSLSYSHSLTPLTQSSLTTDHTCCLGASSTLDPQAMSLSEFHTESQLAALLTLQMFSVFHSNAAPSLDLQKGSPTRSWSLSQSVCAFSRRFLMAPLAVYLSLSRARSLSLSLSLSRSLHQSRILSATSLFSQRVIFLVSLLVPRPNAYVMLAFWEDKMFIVSPQHIQRLATRKSLERAGFSSRFMFVDTVEKMQGQEADVVIVLYSMWNESHVSLNDFVFHLNRLNVAVTRARKKCIFIGWLLAVHSSW